MGAALVKLGKNFVQISQDNAFGQGSAAGFYKVVKAGGGTFPINDTDKGVGHGLRAARHHRLHALPQPDPGFEAPRSSS